MTVLTHYRCLRCRSCDEPYGPGFTVPRSKRPRVCLTCQGAMSASPDPPNDHHEDEGQDTESWTLLTASKVLAAVLAAAAVLYGCGASSTVVSSPGSGKALPPGPAVGHPGVAMPDPHLTPGAVFPTATRSAICTRGYSRRVRHVSLAVKREVYRRYGIRFHRPGSYEVDHLVALELGGSNNIANLWPEPYAGAHGARTKDGLEDELHARMCARDISLETAQQTIARDWYKAWMAAGRPRLHYHP